MKKIIAVLLSLICLFSIFTFAASAALDSKDDESSIMYGIVYVNEAPGVKIYYQANPSLDFKCEGYVTVTKDTPIAVNHDFVCWKDEDGNLYYEGDVVHVDRLITLYAVWEPKTDSYPEIVRIIRCALLSFERFILQIFGIFKDINDFQPASPAEGA